MSLDLLFEFISENYRQQIDSLKNGAYSVSLGLPRAARLPVLTTFWNEMQFPIIFVTERADRALSVSEELAIWNSKINCQFFPEPNSLFYEKSTWGENTRRERLISLATLTSYYTPGATPPKSPPIIIVSARALMSRTLPRRDYLKATSFYKISQKINLEQTLTRWFFLGYERVNTVIKQGQFAKRGGIVDIWSIPYDHPIRIEFFGDQIETLRFFDPSTQRTINNSHIPSFQKFIVTPSREYVISEEQFSSLKNEFEELNEFYIPLIYANPGSLLDYLPQKSLVVLDDEINLQETITEIEEQSEKLRVEFITQGAIQEDFPTPYLSWSELDDNLDSRQKLQLGPGYGNLDQISDNYNINSPFILGKRFGGRLKDFIDHVSEIYQHGNHILIVSRQISRIEELWNEHQLIFSNNKFTPGQEQNEGSSTQLPTITFIPGSLREGFILNNRLKDSIYLFSDSEIFGIRPPEPRQRIRVIANDPESTYADLQAGDYVVHIDHGIGIYIGLVNRSIDGLEREYLCVEYANESQLFIPVYQADRLSRYVGPDNRHPSLSRLGGTEWRTIKDHVTESVKEVAQDLLDLYAKRSISIGYRFSKDTTWQHELELSFPYIETEDQIRVLNEVKVDMEASRPMDRLICGDVGYGKTEVALRAAFKCVMDGKQVIMLVPTTILAQQHFDTFNQRLSAFPITVEMLSRFRTNNEQQNIISKLKQGAIDIIIGTHRLLSTDVSIKDLGLLIIDEEQRFGVTHKEKLKKLRTEVDVLTLTATPIPRTLYMALTGVRDISTINTPPEERLPVITHVGPYAPDLVRKAILRELDRGGQVFFVHNRVQTIRGMANHLEKLIPEAKIAIAHGQMPEVDLSERMRQFTQGEIDVLISTSIIESGLDIPNANTLIVDRADTFGLAQLYQLRGRVGRGALRAYAYFFRHPKKIPTNDGKQRLETIAENTQLGAGFSIAMRDLEIRGTGDILGTRQSGHVAAVGFHLYTYLLSQAVRQLREPYMHSIIKTQYNGSDESIFSPNVDLPFGTSIPSNYVPDKHTRLKLYRRLAEIHTLTELDTISEEFDDRFGQLPQELKNLLFQLKIKILSKQAGIDSIGIENQQLVLRFIDGKHPESVPELLSPARIGKTAIWIPYNTSDNWQNILIETLASLERINDHEPTNQMG